VTSVVDLGDKLRVGMQGVGDADADWRPMNVVSFECASTLAAQRTFYVGRSVTVEIGAKP
jgi:hypothetical protein